MLDGQDAKKLLGDLGLDPLKDVETVTFATCDTKIKDIENTQKLAIIRGTFDAEKLFKTAEARSKKEGDKFEMVKDGNTVMFKIQPDNNQPPWYATVVNDKTVIAASEKKLVSATVAAAAASKGRPDQEGTRRPHQEVRRQDVGLRRDSAQGQARRPEAPRRAGHALQAGRSRKAPAEDGDSPRFPSRSVPM